MWKWSSKAQADRGKLGKKGKKNHNSFQKRQKMYYDLEDNTKIAREMLKSDKFDILCSPDSESMIVMRSGVQASTGPSTLLPLLTSKHLAM